MSAMSKAKAILGGPWHAVATSILVNTSEPRSWSIEDKGNRFELNLGEDVPPLSFLRLSEASVVQGMLTIAKAAVDAELCATCGESRGSHSDKHHFVTSA